MHCVITQRLLINSFVEMKQKNLYYKRIKKKKQEVKQK